MLGEGVRCEVALSREFSGAREVGEGTRWLGLVSFLFDCKYTCQSRENYSAEALLPPESQCRTLTDGLGETQEAPQKIVPEQLVEQS